MSKENIHIFLDLDGVLANFVGGVEKEFDVKLDDLSSWGMADKINKKKGTNLTTKEFWKRIQENPRFWFDLEPYPWARDLVNLTMEKTKGNVTIVTSPDMAAHTYGQKAGWVMKFYPGLARKLFVGPQKHLLAQPNRILIDDSDDNIKKFKEAGGKTITFPQKWNSTGFNFFESQANPIGYIEENLDVKIANIVQ